MPSVKETFNARVVGVDSTITLYGESLGGFLAKTSGAVTVVSGGVTIVNAIPVVAGVFTPMPFAVTKGATLTTSGGASGTAGN